MKQLITFLILLIVCHASYAQHDYRFKLRSVYPASRWSITFDSGIIYSGELAEAGDYSDHTSTARLTDVLMGYNFINATYGHYEKYTTYTLSANMLYKAIPINLELSTITCTAIAEVWWSPDGLSLSRSSATIPYGNTLILTPSSTDYIGPYNTYIVNNSNGDDILLDGMKGVVKISLDLIMDDLNSIGAIVSDEDDITVSFKTKFFGNDFMNKSATTNVTFIKPTISLAARTNTVCRGETISLSTNINGNVDWYVQAESGPYKLFRTNDSTSITTNIDELDDYISIETGEDKALSFKARPTGKDYDIVIPKSIEYYGDPLPEISIDTTPAACSGVNNGQITINVASGTGTDQLLYGLYPLDKDGNIIDFDAQETQESGRTASFPELDGNTRYEIMVQNIADSIEKADGDNYSELRCATKITHTLGLIGPPEIDPGNTTTDSTTCSYLEDGRINTSLSFKGNGSTFTFNIFNDEGVDIQRSSEYTSYSFTNLAPGNYNLKVIDTVGCISDTLNDITVSKPYTLDFNEYVLTTKDPYNVHISCYSGQDGEIIINATGGTAPYTYFYSEKDSTTNNTISNLNAGPYSLMIKDINNCNSRVILDTLKEPSKVIFDSVNTNNIGANGFDVSCPGNYDGHITSFASGGVGDYNFSVNNSNFYPSTIPNLSDGNYLIHVKDGNGCEDSMEVSLSAPPPLIPYLKAVPKYHGYGVSCVNSEGTDSKDGIVICSISGGVPEYARKWPDLDDLPVSDFDTTTITNLEAGIYEISYTDANGCVASLIDTIKVPPVIETVIDTLTTPVCYKEINGTLTVKAINGLAPYTFSINGDDFFTSPSDTFTFTGLGADTYSITARDSNFAVGSYSTCTGTTSHELPQKERVEVDFTVFNPYCSGDIGSILATITSGPGDSNNYSYEWREVPNTAIIGTDSIFSNKPSNELYFQLTVFDEQNCNRTFTDLIITEPVPMAFISIDNNNTTCASINNGTISINMNLGGTAPLQFSIDGGVNFQNDTYFDSLSAGNYYIIVEDANGCQLDSLITIENGEVIANIDSLTMVTCNSFNDGYIKLSATGGQGVYEYSIDNGSTFSGVNEYYVTAGTYNALVRDVNTNCTSDIVPVTITEPDALSVTALLIDSSACGQALGIAGQTITGGSGYFDTLWYASGNPIPLTSASSLTSGQYLVNITDLNSTGCIASDTLFVPEREAPVITSLDIIKQPWCNKPLGSVTVSATGGSPVYSYQWSDSLNQTTQTAINLFAKKTYSITVTDQYNCSDYSTIVLTNGPAIAATNTTQDAACGQDNGSVTLNVTGGVSPYKFKWNDTIATDTLLINTMDNLYAGEYTVYISDSLGCTVDYSLDISNIGAPTIEITKVQKSYCELNTGIAAITPNGGVPGYAYKWTLTEETGAVSSDSIAVDLYAGNYRVRVTDSKNCIVYENITIADSIELEPDLSILNISPSACDKYLGSATAQMNEGLAPYSYQWNTGDTDSIASNLHSGQYTVTATDARGCVQDTSVTVVDNPDPKIYYTSQAPSACGKALGSVTVGIEEGLPPYNCFVVGTPSELFSFGLNPVSGNYEATVTGLSADNEAYSIIAVDSNGCSSDTAKAIINDAPDMEIRLVNIEPVSCFGGTDGQAEITVLNGTAPYSYSWQGNDDDSVYTDKLPAYANTVTVTDLNGCSVEKTIDISTPDSIRVINFVSITPTCYGGADGSISVAVAGGNQPYNYLWQDGQTNYLASNIPAGVYTVTISDSKGCAKENSFELDNPVKIEDTDVIKELLLCEGQLVTLDPGIDYISSTWVSSTGFNSTDKTITVSEPGSYYLEALTQNGCPVTDTVVLETSSNLLTTEFLMQSEGNTGDTIALVEVSWPVPDQIIWELPKEAKQLASTTESEFIQFSQEGYYYIELTAHLAECVDVVGKYIDITEDVSEEAKRIFTNNKDNLLSLEVAPNPNRGRFIVSFEFEEEAPAIIEIITLTGTIIKSIDAGDYLTDYSMEINIEGTPAGTYLLNLKSNSNNTFKPFIVY